MKADATEVRLLTVTEAETSPLAPRLAPENEIQVEIITGEATEEQKAAIKRFMDWYMAKVISDESSKNHS